MAAILTRQEFYDRYITELQSQAAALGINISDTSEGSIVDLLAGVTAMMLSEMSELTVTEFAKTFFDSADGPEVTGGDDDLQTLAVDHFGEDFERPEASKAVGTVTFSRASSGAGDCTIPAGTVVQTAANSNGVKTRFVTQSDVTMTGLSISASIEAETAGTGGNVLSGTINSVASTLTDPTIGVTNADATSGGEDEEDDATYRQTIRNKIKQLKGATLAAIEAAALDVPGVVTATAIEKLLTVIEFNVATGLPKVGATYFGLPYAYLYVADANGTANSALVALVQTAIDKVRAAGVQVRTFGATAVSLNWTASVTLNVSGPNFAELSSDKSKIEATMTQYLAGLAIGTGFDRATAEVAILAVWGPSGTNDLTAFTTTTPSGNVAVGATYKVIPGTVTVA
jgi:hypothetical protein